MRRRSLLVAVMAAGLAFVTFAAYAAWSGAITGTGLARAQTLTGNKPTGTVSGSNVTVTWTASTFSDGVAATGYTVRRYSFPGGTVQTVGANCSGTITGTSCTENGVPTGTWQYTVTPSYSTWTGAESTKSDAVVVAALDTTKPTTTASPSPAANAAGWYNANVTVTLTATDPAPGVVKQITYSATGVQSFGPTTVLGSSATVPAITIAGTTNLDYFAEDLAGNVETTKTLVVKLDKTPPSATLAALPSRIRNGQSLTGTYTDAGSGIASVTYYYCVSTTATCTAANGTSAGSSSTSPYSLTWNSQPADGDYKVVVNAVDAAGNATLSNVVTTTVDNTAPTITALSLSNKTGGTAGSVEEDDTIVLTFSEAPDLTTICAGWTGSTVIGADTNNAVTVTLTDGGTTAPDTISLSVANAQCSTFNFGPIALGAAGSATNYVTGGGSANIRYRGNSAATRSTVSWDATNLRLTILLGAADPQNGGTPGTVGSPGTQATYTPSPSIKDLAGNQVSGTASNPATSGSTAQQF